MNRFIFTSLLILLPINTALTQNDSYFFSIKDYGKNPNCIHSLDTYSAFNVLQNDSGAIIYLKLSGYKETEQFLSEFKDFDSIIKLKTLIINDFSEQKHYDKLLDFISKKGQSLEHLHFTRSSGKPLTSGFLSDIINLVLNYPIIDFRWENQESIDDPSFYTGLISKADFWRKLHTVSFNKTKISSKAFFVHRISFDSLQNLELAETGINATALDSILGRYYNFPSLRCVNLNEMDFSWKYPITNRYQPTQISTISLFRKKAGFEEYITFINKKQNWLMSVEQLLFNLPKQARENSLKDNLISSSGAFIFNYKKPIASNNFGEDESFLKRFKEINRNGFFNRPYDTLVHKNKLPKGCKLIVTSQTDIDLLLSCWPIDTMEELIFFSPNIETTHLENFLRKSNTYPKLKHVFLVQTSVKYSDYESFCMNDQFNNIKFHLINKTPINTESTFYWDPFLFRPFMMRELIPQPKIKFK